MVIEESLKEFYRANHLDEHWMGIAIADKRLKVWPMRLIPKSLRDWLKVHDAHHLITGYDTDLAGEAEIAAWALPRNGLNFGSSSWVLPFLTAADSVVPILIGLILMPKRVINAWRKGKGEHSLHKLDSELVLAMEFDEARHYVATGEIPTNK